MLLGVECRVLSFVGPHAHKRSQTANAADGIFGRWGACHLLPKHWDLLGRWYRRVVCSMIYAQERGLCRIQYICTGTYIYIYI